MKILHKTLKKQWFDMIAAGIKKHEYLEIKPYWVTRLCYDFYSEIDGWDKETIASAIGKEDCRMKYEFKIFDIVHAFNGGSLCHTYPNIKWKHEGIEIGEGNPEWGAEPGKKYFILKIGDLIL